MISFKGHKKIMRSRLDKYFSSNQNALAFLYDVFVNKDVLNLCQKSFSICFCYLATVLTDKF